MARLMARDNAAYQPAGDPPSSSPVDTYGAPGQGSDLREVLELVGIGVLFVAVLALPLVVAYVIHNLPGALAL